MFKASSRSLGKGWGDQDTSDLRETQVNSGSVSIRGEPLHPPETSPIRQVSPLPPGPGRGQVGVSGAWPPTGGDLETGLDTSVNELRPQPALCHDGSGNVGPFSENGLLSPFPPHLTLEQDMPSGQRKALGADDLGLLRLQDPWCPWL